MEAPPPACPACQSSAISFSTGVVKPLLPDVCDAYPVIKCAQCGHNFYFQYATRTWKQCAVPSDIPFTTDPHEIDENNAISL